MIETYKSSLGDYQILERIGPEYGHLNLVYRVRRKDGSAEFVLKDYRLQEWEMRTVHLNSAGIFDLDGTRFSDRFQKVVDPDIVLSDGQPSRGWAVMTYLPGENPPVLAPDEYLVDDCYVSPLRVRRLNDLGEQWLETCVELWGDGHPDSVVVHRDMKDSNAVLGPDGVLRVIDVDMATHLSAVRGPQKEIFGSFMFMDPHVIVKREYSDTTDLCSVLRSWVQVLMKANCMYCRSTDYEMRRSVVEQYRHSTESQRRGDVMFKNHPHYRRMESLGNLPAMESVREIMSAWRTLFLDCLKHPDVRPKPAEALERIREATKA